MLENGSKLKRKFTLLRFVTITVYIPRRWFTTQRNTYLQIKLKSMVKSYIQTVIMLSLRGCWTRPKTTNGDQAFIKKSGNRYYKILVTQ